MKKITLLLLLLSNFLLASEEKNEDIANLKENFLSAQQKFLQERFLEASIQKAHFHVNNLENKSSRIILRRSINYIDQRIEQGIPYFLAYRDCIDFVNWMIEKDSQLKSRNRMFKGAQDQVELSLIISNLEAAASMHSILHHAEEKKMLEDLKKNFIPEGTLWKRSQTSFIKFQSKDGFGT